MKPSFKTSIFIAAFGIIIYTIFVVTRYILNKCNPESYHYDLWSDICVRVIFDILPLCLIVAGIGLWNFRPAKNASKAFRVFTICIFAALVVTLLLSPLFTAQIAGIAYLFPPIYWRVLLLVSGIVWLFMLLRQPLEETSNRSYRATLVLAMILLALPIILELISGISLLCGRDAVLGLGSGAIKTWVKYIAPILPLAHFIFLRVKH